MECDEYIPVLAEYADISVWVSSSLLRSINPKLFGVNIDGGVVRVDFKNKGSIFLHQITPTDVKAVIPAKPPIIENKQYSNILQHQLRDL